MDESEILIQERCQKQTYLREHILNAGYNSNLFQNYVESLKEDGNTLIFIKNELKDLTLITGRFLSYRKYSSG